MPCVNCEQQTPCNCPIKDLGTDCVAYNQDQNLDEIGSPKGTILSTILQNINAALKDIRETLATYFQLSNVGTGAQVYKGVNSIGIKLIRSITNGQHVDVVENENDIEISVPDASTTVQGAMRAATNVETDEGALDNVAVSPASLAHFIYQSYSPPLATVDQRGIVELATQAEVDAGSDTERAVTPSTLANWTGFNIPLANTVQRGIIEIATQAEVDAGTDSERAVTPETLANFPGLGITAPDATTEVKGIVELATQAEVDARTDTDRAITPSSMGSFVSNAGDTFAASTKVSNVVTLSQAEYDGIGSPDPGTMYVIV